MRRYLVLGAIAVFCAGFHEWSQPRVAQAAAHCFTAPPEDQFDSTYALENADGTFVAGVLGQARFECSVNWRGTFQMLYKAPADSSWHLGFENALYAPTITGHYTAFQDVFFQPAVTPEGFTGYWTPGDGLHAARPICQWQWRLRERFTNTGNGTLDNTLYTPTVNPTC